MFLLGVTNAGKSVLFNRLLSSDYCQVLASNALIRATTSYWPNTTLNMLKFPITKLNKEMYLIRKQRLRKDREREKETCKTKFETFKRTFKIEDAELYGIVNMSFKPNLKEPENIHEKIESPFNITSTYSFENDKIKEQPHVESFNKLLRNRTNEARKEYDPSCSTGSYHFFDTPGIQLREHPLK